MRVVRQKDEGLRGYATLIDLLITLWLTMIRQACDMCRKKKIKCDGKMPKCSHCINYKTECIFTQVEKKRNPPKGSKLSPTDHATVD